MDEADVLEFHQSGLTSSYLSTLETMKENDVLCDVVIHVRNQSLRAHRNILAAGIPYFTAMFTCNMKESMNREITMEDVDPQALELLINFVYTSKLNITKSNALSLLETSLYLQLDCVRDACIKYITKRFDPDSVLPFYNHAARLDNAEVLEKFSSYITDSFLPVSMSKEFLNLSFPSLKEFIGRDDLNVESEEVVFEAVMRWVNASECDREAYLPDLLLNMRMPLLSPEYLLFKVQEERLIVSSPVCRKIVSEAILYHTPSRKKFKTWSCTTRKRCGKKKHSVLYAIFCTETLKTSIKHYDPTNKKWCLLHDGESMGHAEYFACTEERIYFLGGRYVAAIDLETQKWTYMECNGRFPVAAGVALHQRRVYFFGGRCGSSKVSHFNLDLGTFVHDGHMGNKRILPGVASSGDNIYICGGYHRHSVFTSGEKCDLDTGQISRISPMNTARFGHGCTALNGKIYVYGGRTSKTVDSFTSTSEVYDPSTDTWYFVKKPSNITGYVSLVSYANKLRAVAAKKQEKDHFHVKVYEPKVNEWKANNIISDSSNCRNLTALVSNSAACLKDIPDSLEDEAADEWLYSTRETYDFDSDPTDVHLG